MVFQNQETCPMMTKLTQRALDPWKSTRTIVVGLPSVGTACAFLDSFRGLKLVPSKWRSLVPPTSTPKGHNASRWDCRISLFSKIIFEKWERNAEKCLVFGVPHNILATFWQFLSLLWEIFMDIFRTRGFSTVSLGGLNNIKDKQSWEKHYLPCSIVALLYRHVFRSLAHLRHLLQAIFLQRLGHGIQMNSLR